jgi:hypothetical protein
MYMELISQPLQRQRCEPGTEGDEAGSLFPFSVSLCFTSLSE